MMTNEIEPYVPHSGPIHELHFGDVLAGDGGRWFIYGLIESSKDERWVKIEAMNKAGTRKDIRVSDLLKRFVLVDVNVTGHVAWRENNDGK